MVELTLQERLKVYIAINPDMTETSVNTVDLLRLVKFAEEGERVLQAEAATQKKLQRMLWVVYALALWNLFFVFLT